MIGRALRLVTLALVVTGAVRASAQEATDKAESPWDIMRRIRTLTPSEVKQQRADQSKAGAKKPKKVKGGKAPFEGETPKKSDRLLGGLRSKLQRIGEQTKSEVKLQGSHNLGFHMEQVNGSRDAYDSSQYLGRKALGGGYTSTDLAVRGKLFGILNFETHYSDYLYGSPYDNRLSLDYVTRDYKVNAGDIQAGLTGNSLIGFSKSLKGIQVTANLARNLRLTSLVSKSKAQTRTVTLNGANRSGPYYVFAGQIVDGSERVRVNNRELVKGTDYTLDPYTGELNFLNGLIVHELDTIAVTFEVYNYGQSGGAIMGWRADYGGTSGPKVGFSMLSQVSGSNKGVISRTEQFYGYNSATTPYTLELPVDVTLVYDTAGKLTGCTPKYPMTVTVGTLPQAYGTDFVVDPLLPNRVYFQLPIPSTQIIRITYTPVTSTETQGDRQVMGFDAQMAMGKSGTITAEMASSKLSLSGGPSSGTAVQIRGENRLAGEKLRLNWVYKNISPAFTAVESPGFNRNERGIQTDIAYTPSKRVSITANYQRSRRPQYSYSTSSTGGLAASTGMDDYNQNGITGKWELGKGSLSVSHNSMNTTYSGGTGNSVMQSDTLAYTTNTGPWGIDLSLGRNVNRSSGSYSSSVGATATSYNTDALTSRLGLRWKPGERYSVDAQISDSIMKSGTGGSNNALDLQLTGRVVPMKALQLTLNLQKQDSGGYSIFNNTTGSTATAPGLMQRLQSYYTGGGTYGGGGFNTGLGGSGNYSGGFNSGYYGMGSGSFGGNSRMMGLTASYQPAGALSIEAQVRTSASAGDYMYNSKRNDLSMSATYNAGERLSLSSGLMLQKVTYLGTEGGSNNMGVFINARGKPWGKLVTDLSVSVQNTTSTATTDTTGTGGYTGGYGTYFGSGGTNLASVRTRLEYPVWHATNVFAEYEHSNSTGYLAALARRFNMGLVFDMGRQLRLQVGMRHQQSISHDTSTSGNYSYSVSSFDADLGLNF